jgi:hypothetical protein
MGFEPVIILKQKQSKNWIEIKCPLRFAYPEIDQTCIKEICAWWLPIQKACAVQVLSRGNTFPNRG